MSAKHNWCLVRVGIVLVGAVVATVAHAPAQTPTAPGSPTPELQLEALVATLDLADLGLLDECQECWEATCDGTPEDPCEEGDGTYHAGNQSTQDCPGNMEGPEWAGCEHELRRDFSHDDPHKGFCTNHTFLGCNPVSPEPVAAAVESRDIAMIREFLKQEQVGFNSERQAIQVFACDGAVKGQILVPTAMATALDGD